MRRRSHGDKSSLCPFVAERRLKRPGRRDLRRLLDVGKIVSFDRYVRVGSGGLHNDRGEVGLRASSDIGRDFVRVAEVEDHLIRHTPRVEIVLAIPSLPASFCRFGFKEHDVAGIQGGV